MTGRTAPLVLAVVQRGRLEAEALLLAASLRAASPKARLVLAEPRPGTLWPEDPRIGDDTRAALRGLGAEILAFDSRAFGAAYPHGNKIEALALLGSAPVLFLDTDTLVLGDLGALPWPPATPAASMRREATWPVERPGLAPRAEVWGALYRRMGLDIAASLDPSWPEDDWRRYLYFNAGWVVAPDAAALHRAWLEAALVIRDDPPAAARGQPLDPWLDQAALPLAVHAQGGGRPGPALGGLDGGLTCHWRSFPLLYAREPDAAVAAVERLGRDAAIGALLARHKPFRRFVLEGWGERARALFDRSALPPEERLIRKRLREAGLWLR